MIMLDGGFFDEKPLPGTDQADFAPRIKAPTLMIGGKFDWVSCWARTRCFGCWGRRRPTRKRSCSTPRTMSSEQRADLMREVVAWLDKYLGKVN